MKLERHSAGPRDRGRAALAATCVAMLATSLLASGCATEDAPVADTEGTVINGWVTHGVIPETHDQTGDSTWLEPVDTAPMSSEGPLAIPNVNVRTTTYSPPGQNVRLTVKLYVGRELPNGNREVFVTLESGLSTAVGNGIPSDRLTYSPVAPLADGRDIGSQVSVTASTGIASLTGKLNVDRLNDYVRTGNLPSFVSLSATYTIPRVGASASFGVTLGFENGELVVTPSATTGFDPNAKLGPSVGAAVNFTLRTEFPRDAANAVLIPIPGFTNVSPPALPPGDDPPALPGNKQLSKYGAPKEKAPNEDLTPFDIGDQIGTYPTAEGDAAGYFEQLSATSYVFDDEFVVPEYSYDSSSGLLEAIGLLDQGVNFQNIRLSGFVPDSASGAPFFRLEVERAPAGQPGVSKADIDAAIERFKKYFLEGIAIVDGDYRISVDSETGPNGERNAVIDVPASLLVSNMGRVMVDADIRMKRTFLADIVRGEEAVVNDGIFGLWFSLLAQSPHYGAWLQAGELPALSLSVRGLIVGGDVQVAKHNSGGYYVVDAPLDFLWFIDALQLSKPEAYRGDQASDLAARINTLRSQLEARISSRVPGFIDVLNTSAEYDELRRVYLALANAKLYKAIAPSLSSVPYLAFYNSNQIPNDVRPADPFPTSEFLDRVKTTAGTERATFPCGTLPDGQTFCPSGEFQYEIFGGVDWVTVNNADQGSSRSSWGRLIPGSIGFISEGQTGAVSVGTALAGDLPEYSIRLTPSGAAGEPYQVVMTNLGTSAPPWRYVVVEDIATNEDGEVISRQQVIAFVNQDVSTSGQTRAFTFGCATCDTPVAGASRRWLQATVNLGVYDGGSNFDLVPELNRADNLATLELP